MPSDFPTALDSFVDPTTAENLSTAAGGLGHAGVHALVHDAIEQIEAKVGIDDSSDDTSYDYILKKILGTFTGDEVSITTTATATIDRMNVCSGTSSNYTVTLPTAVGNTGRMIGFRMSSALTKLVTLDGNSSETVGGATTRSLWANEAALFKSDGSNWVKVAYAFIPMSCTMRLDAHQTGVANATVTKVQLDKMVTDNSGFMADTTNKRINVGRVGNWRAVGTITFGGSTGGTGLDGNASRILTRIYFDGSVVGQNECSGLAGGYPAPGSVKEYPASSGSDNFELYGFQNQGGNGHYYGGAGQETFFTVSEVLSW